MKPFYVIGLLVSVLTLTGCSVGPVPTTSTSSVACPSQDFRNFFTAFADSIPVQRAFVADSVQSESIDTSAQPEPKPIVKSMRVSQLSFPLMPSTRQQASEKLQMTLRTSSSDEATAKLAKEDTDYQLTFFFRKQDGCWKLYRLVNDSL